MGTCVFTGNHQLSGHRTAPFKHQEIKIRGNKIAWGTTETSRGDLGNQRQNTAHAVLCGSGHTTLDYHIIHTGNILKDLQKTY